MIGYNYAEAINQFFLICREFMPFMSRRCVNSTVFNSSSTNILLISLKPLLILSGFSYASYKVIGQISSITYYEQENKSSLKFRFLLFVMNINICISFTSIRFIYYYYFFFFASEAFESGRQKTKPP